MSQHDQIQILREIGHISLLGIPVIAWIAAVFMLSLAGMIAVIVTSPKHPYKPKNQTQTANLVTLADCPPGLFLLANNLHIKTEYGEAYDCQNGQFIWGVTTTHLEERAALRVLPLTITTA